MFISSRNILTISPVKNNLINKQILDFIFFLSYIIYFLQILRYTKISQKCIKNLTHRKPSKNRTTLMAQPGYVLHKTRREIHYLIYISFIYTLSNDIQNICLLLMLRTTIEI